MGREVRRVPAYWDHPKEFNIYRDREEYKPLHGGVWKAAAEQWDKEREEWESGIRPSYASDEGDDMPFDQWSGPRPYSAEYMPQWSEAEKTHLMMYENTTEGTPISPAFETAEELARWLADTGASAFGSSVADYDHWLAVCRGGYAPSMVIGGGKIMSGVEFCSTRDD